MREPTETETRAATELCRRRGFEPSRGAILMQAKDVQLVIRSLSRRGRSWTTEEADAMVTVYAKSLLNHGHREALFAVVNAFIDAASPEIE